MHYMALGVQRMGNTQRLFDRAQAMGAIVTNGTAFSPLRLADTIKQIDGFIEPLTALHLTICLDVFGAAFAPGVSSPNPLGLSPDANFMETLHKVLASGKVISTDIAEMNPIYDSDSRTARLAAALAFELIHAYLV